jgi:hypothetical protein
VTFRNCRSASRTFGTSSKNDANFTVRTAGAGRNDGRDRSQTRRSRPRRNHFGNFRARSLCARNDFADAKHRVESGAVRGAQKITGGDGPAALNFQLPTINFFAARRDRLRQNGNLSASARARTGAGQGRDCARAGNFFDAANRRAVQGAVQFGKIADARGGFAFSFERRANGTTNGTKSGRAGRASSSARARRFLRRSNRSASSSWTRNTRHSYKQEEAPRYHARDVAIMRGQMENAVVVLGSATPSLESFYNCQEAANSRCSNCRSAWTIKKCRTSASWTCARPRQRKRPPLFSPQLKEAITQRLERGEQTILFLNRRGYSTSLQCPEVRLRGECPNCSITLTYHRPEQKLACHICGHVEKVPLVCPEPKCKNPAIRFAGTGTQKRRGDARQTFSQGAHQAHGRRHDETQGRLPPSARRFSRGQN